MTDTVISAILVLVVIRQIREAKLEPHVLALPIVMVALSGQHYLHDVSVGGNDRVLIALLVGTGAVLGVAGGCFTRMRLHDGDVLIRAGWVAVALWVGSMGARAAFVYGVSHGFGDNVARFSVAHGITSQQAWAVALIGMAIAEVTLRMVVIFARGHRLAASASMPALAAA